MSHLHSHPYGVGLAYRHVIHDPILKNAGSIDLLELPTEDYIVRQRRVNADREEALLAEAVSTFPSVAHGISLSIGTVEPLNRDYLRSTLNFLNRHQIDTFSEHLAFHRMDRRDLTIFLAMPFEEVSVQWVKHNYEATRAALGRPFALENVTYYFPAPGSSLSEADFLRRLTEETDCSLLLDVTNVFNNAHNHGYDPYEFIGRLPLDRVSQLHLAGGHFLPGENKWEDSHSQPVMNPVWPLYEEVVKQSASDIVILERDSRFHPFEVVMEDVHRAREIFYKHRPAESPATGVGLKEAPVDLENLPLPDPEAREFAPLRGYQKGVMGRITDRDFRRSFDRNPSAALDTLGLSPEWRERVRKCDPYSMKKLEQMWDAIEQEDRLEKEQFERQEWAAWAQMAGANAA